MPRQTIIVREADEPAVSSRLALLLSVHGDPIAKLIPTLEDGSKNTYYIFSGEFTDAELTQLGTAITSSLVVKDTGYWKDETSDALALQKQLSLTHKPES